MLSGSTLNSLTNITSLRKYVVVSFLNKASITLPADVKTRVCEIEAQVVSYLQRLGMRENEIFGIALPIDDEFVFVDGENKLGKYASRQWKISNNGLDNVGNPLLKFLYRVKYYLHSSTILRDQVSRLHYYLQLRENVLNYNQDLQEEEIFGLVSLALQADLGDFNPDIQTSQYFDPSQYFPQWILVQMGISYVLERIPNFHKKLKGLSKSDAQTQFIQEASLTDSPHNVHLYQLRRKKHDPCTQVAVSISDKGIGIYDEERINNKSSKKLIQSFLWSNIEDLSFDKKKFEIRAACYTGKLTFFTSSDEKSKHLLQLCRLTHQFSRNHRWRTSESFRTSTHDEKSRGDFAYIEVSQFRKRELFSSFGGSYIDPEENNQIASPCLNSLAISTSGIASERILPSDDSQDLEKERRVFSTIGHSTESGVASITMSLSTCSATARSKSLSHDVDLNNSMLQHTPPGSPDVNSFNWKDNTKFEGSIFGRTSSIHSSSSQHSSSTVRSRYSFVPSRDRHELALGAQLADLSLAPDLPDLADFPSMAARGDESSDSIHHVHSKSHNCCSTCFDDNASLASEEAGSEIEDAAKDICRCGSCTSCLHTSLPDKFENVRLYLSYENPEKTCEHIFPSNLLFTDNDSVAAQPDLDETLGSNYNFSEEDFSQLDNNDDYVEFYKRGGIRYYGHRSALDKDENENKDELVFVNLSSNSEQDINIQKENLLQQVLLGKKKSPVHEEQTLDYSVESAQGTLVTSYSVKNSENSWTRLMSREDNRHKRFVQPFPVSMSKVTTVTPVSIASSRFSLSPTSPDMKENFNESSLLTSEAAIEETSSSIEAPAKFITSKPRIAVLTAQTQLASTTAPSFTSVPLTRAKIHTLPQVQYRSKSNDIQSLQRTVLPNPKPLKLISPYAKENLSFGENCFPDQVPVIQSNNYLDVHASSNLNKERIRTHPEQLPSKTPRSLFLKNQKKKLHRESIQNKHHMEQLHQQLLDETVYQAAAYAQGVGVPLKPSPKYSRCRSSKPKGELPVSCFETPSVSQQNMLYTQNICHPCNLAQKPCYHFHHHSGQNDLEIPHQNILYQPNNRNIFRNPNLSMLHPGLGVNFCPSDQNESVNADILIPYQRVSDPGIYPPPNEQHSSATVYTNQVTQSQIEQFQAQLNSDTDYVIYPHKDPAISRQEYMDAKQSQFIASNAQKQGTICGPLVLDQVPPPYKSSKSCSLYRSAPNVAGSFTTSTFLSSYPSYQSLASQGSTHQPGSSSGYSSMARGRYFSQQSLASSFSSVPSTYSASTQSLTGSFDPYSDTISIPKSPPAVVRVRSDESILSSSGGLTETDTFLESFHTSNIPPRPPPLPYRHKEVFDNSGDGTKAILWRGSATCSRSRSQPRVTLQQVRERGNQLDVPLLSALCSDSSLLMQRNLRSIQKNYKHSRISRSSHRDSSSHPSSSAEVSPSSKETLINFDIKPAKSDTWQDKYFLTGVYTTNQVPAPHLSSRVSKFPNGAHQHPKVKCKIHSHKDMFTEAHHGPCSSSSSSSSSSSKQKQCKTSKEKRDNQKN